MQGVYRRGFNFCLTWFELKHTLKPLPLTKIPMTRNSTSRIKLFTFVYVCVNKGIVEDCTEVKQCSCGKLCRSVCQWHFSEFPAQRPPNRPVLTPLQRDECHQDPASGTILTSHKEVFIRLLKETNQPLGHPAQVGLQDLWDQHSPATQKR